MRTFGAVVGFIGGLFLVGTPVILLVWVWDLVRWSLARRAVAGRSRVVLHGVVTAPGGDHLRAPMSGVACAWYRLVLLRTDQRDYDGGTAYDTKTIWSRASSDHVHVGGGTVAVTLLERRLIDNDSPVVQRSGARDKPGGPMLDHLMAVGALPAGLLRGGKRTEFELFEDVVPTGTTATVVGRRGRRLTAGFGPVYGATGETPSAMVAKLHPGRDSLTTTAVLVVIGGLLALCGWGVYALG